MMQYYDEQPLHMPPMVEAPYGFGIMEPYYGPQWGFVEPPTHVITLPHCKVCEDAGKSPREFHSHWVRESKEPNAKVTCPTLLSQKCNYCKRRGHTIKYCERLKKKEQKRRDMEYTLSRMSRQPDTGYGMEEGEDYSDESDTRTMSTLSENEWPIVG